MRLWDFIGFIGFFLVAEWIHVPIFRDNSTHYNTESVNFLGLMNSATKVFRDSGLRV